MDVDDLHEEDVPRRVKRTRNDVMREMRQPNVQEQLLNTKSHYEEVIRLKDQEIDQLRHFNHNLTEENRVLKKAVAIQEQKLKETTYQGEQLHAVLSQVCSISSYQLKQS